MFPRCRKLFSKDELQELGEELRERKRAIEQEQPGMERRSRDGNRLEQRSENRLEQESSIGQSNAMRSLRQIDG
jgi:hypothetical protein